MLYDDWGPNPEEGLTVFLQGLEKRGPDNRRKRIYISALTPDLYKTMYAEKVARFFDRLLDEKNAGKPLMRYYLDNYFDLFWDLHVGVQGEAVPTKSARSAKASTRCLAIAIRCSGLSTKTI